MADAEGFDAGPDMYAQAAQEAFDAQERAEQARRQARAAQRAAADSLERSAESQDRTARTFEEAASHSGSGRDDYHQHAACHRRYAEEDRLMADRLRRMAESDSASDPKQPEDRRR
jgi:hypothetical protein